MAALELSAFGTTNVGLVRERDEDRFLLTDFGRVHVTEPPVTELHVEVGDEGVLLLVCDGMGGGPAGEVAAQVALQTVADCLMTGIPREPATAGEELRRAVEQANRAVLLQAVEHPQQVGMGTTCTAALIVDGTLIIGQVGDSRCYLHRGGRLRCLTQDQTIGEALVEAGALSYEESALLGYRHILLQALGTTPTVEVALTEIELQRDDVVLLCSDGLHDYAPEERVEQILTGGGDLARLGNALVDAALDGGGGDNVTVLLARIGPPG